MPVMRLLVRSRDHYDQRRWASAALEIRPSGPAFGGIRCNPARQVTARALAGHYRSPGTDLIRADGQRFRSQLWIGPRCRSWPRADGVIPQLEALTGDFNELVSVVGLEPADVIKAAGKHLVVEIEAA